MNTTENRILDYSEPSKSKLEYADFGIRLVASILDFFVLLIIFLLFVYPFVNAEWFMEYILDDSHSSLVVFLYFFGPTLIRSLYHALFECTKFQGSPGKMIVGVKVVDKNGSKLSFLRAFARNVGKTISALILYIGFLIILFSDYRQGLHDLMATTFVVRK